LIVAMTFQARDALDHSSKQPLRTSIDALFPYTTLFRSEVDGVPGCLPEFRGLEHFNVVGKPAEFIGAEGLGFGKTHVDGLEEGEDRKSTRLYSSHVSSSYAGFCLKRKRRMHSSRA